MNSTLSFALALLPLAGAAFAQEAIEKAGMKLVRVPAGEYLRGLPESAKLSRTHPYSPVDQGIMDAERPAHRVKLTKGFLIGSREVTVGQFRAFVTATAFKTDAEKAGGAFVFDPKSKNQLGRFARKPGADWRTPGFDQTDEHPVVCVSLRDAEAYCAWFAKQSGLACRLPTEAEWEYACRAGAVTVYCSGDDPNLVYGFANVGDATLEALHPGEVSRQRLDWKGHSDGFAFTAPVGRFKPNAWGLHDMHGNVWEWCSDKFAEGWYREAVDAAAGPTPKGKVRPRPDQVTVVDPTGPATTTQHKYGDWRSTRGGSWYLAPVHCRSDYRGFAEAGDAFSHTGFRVVCESR